MTQYRLEKDGSFIIHDYNRAAPFASFFPGIAGLFGIPMWVFYVNRGQCIASAGIRSKDEAILEFLPANKAYQQTAAQGFRTFIKVKGAQRAFYEPFSPSSLFSKVPLKNRMVIRPFDLKIVEVNPGLGLEIEASYFTVPHQPWAGLVRQLVVRNVSKKSLDLEFLDGVSTVVPYGLNNWFLKEMSRTMEAWMTVEDMPAGVPLFKLSVDPRDTAHVAFVKGGHFYLGFEEDRKVAETRIIVDPEALFGPATDLSFPIAFVKPKTFAYPLRQGTRSKTPCAFSLVRCSLKKGEQKRFFSVLGHVGDAGDVRHYKFALLDADSLEKMGRENQELVEGIMDRIFTASSLDAFDRYVAQTYLDNVLRGGLPVSLASSDATKRCLYAFSRKHGDLERDYNRFYLPATYLSEGEGNYRDVNQNRRSDCFFEAGVGEQTVVDFMNLIQLDGYNPLIFKGGRLEVPADIFESSGLAGFFDEKDAKKVVHIVSRSFALADLMHYLLENKVALRRPLEELAGRLLSAATVNPEAVFGEGYWSDHWTYNTDLLESFYGVYPDRMKTLLFDKNDFTYFDTHVFVKPRAERYVFQHGEVRQYHALASDEKKNLLIQERLADKHKVRVAGGQGAVLRTTLIDKLLCLIVNKAATLDPFGIGIEMEGGKPDWYDALNGLPGLFGSSVSQTFELKRLLLLLKKYFQELKIPDAQEVAVLPEVFDFIVCLRSLLQSASGDFDYWDKANMYKEDFRSKTRQGVREVPSKKMNIASIREFFDLVLLKLDAGIARSIDTESVYRTYFSHSVSRHETTVDAAARHVILPKEFRQERLPLFLEGFVHALRTETGKAKEIYNAVRRSPLWDRKLKMYKVNASLEAASYEIGRARAFTPGWLENESIWLHMEYKYLLELLKNGLCEEFYDDFFNVLIPFQDANVYGRSILENSSFLVSSAYFQASRHGRGFVARLSGSTAEVIHMWLLMNLGHEPFFLDEKGVLALRFRPRLSGKFFTKRPVARNRKDSNGRHLRWTQPACSYSFLFMGKTLVTYTNSGRKNTFGDSGVAPQRIVLTLEAGGFHEFEGGIVPAPFAERVRRGDFEEIEITLG